MSILNQILGREDKGPIAVPTPEWPALNGKLAVRKLTAFERASFYVVAAKERPEAGIQFQALMAAHCTTVREPLAEGAVPRRAFCDGDWKALVNDPGSGSAIERLADAADELNVLTDGARETIKKKYETTAGCESSSASPTPSA